MSSTKKVVICLLIALIALPLSGFGYIYLKLNSIYEVEENIKHDDYEYINADIINILLIGVDGENIDKGNRSDCMIVLTIDNANKDIRLTSLARDTYVEIPGYGYEKLNHSFSYEGASLLMETINKNFEIPIDKYITVSFNSFMEIVDQIGGVDVDIDPSHIDIINATASETYEIYDRSEEFGPIKLITSGGNQTINGYQALAYSRIRYTDNGYARDGRQREVISSVYSKLLQQEFTSIKKATDILLGNCKTNIAPLEMVEIGMKAFNIRDNQIEQLEFPLATHRRDVIKEEKGYVIEWENDYNKNVIRSFIYDYNEYKKLE